MPADMLRGRRSITALPLSSLCAALKSTCEHRNPQQRAAAGHVEHALVRSAEPQVLAAPRDAPEGDDAEVLSGGAQNLDPRFRQRIKPAITISDQAIGIR